MKRIFLGLFIALAATIAAVASSPNTAYADHNRFLQAIPTQTQIRVLERGYGIYCVNQNAAAYPNFRQQLQTVYADEQARVGIPWIESGTGQDCDIINLMVSTSNFPCGSGAAACIYYANDPVTIYYLGDLLYSSWRSTIGHEHGHWDGSHERYIDSEDRFFCDSRATYTRMSCGTGVWWVTDYDLFVAWNVMVPDAPMNIWLTVDGDWTTVRWDQYRADCAGQPWTVLNGAWTNLFDGGPAHPTCKNEVATRVAFGWSSGPGEPIEWVGDICGAEFNWCYSPYSVGSRAFDAFWTRPGACFYLRPENAALFWVPQVSAPNYWSFVGCR